MVDIHTHIIHRVDDGSKNIENSLSMLEMAKRAGTSDIICTPHYRKGYFETEKQEIEACFSELSERAKDIGVKLYLGQEVATNKVVNELVKSSSVFTLANSRYVLLEFDYNNFVDIANICFELKVCGYIPIIAHIERYTYVDASDVEEFIDSGALIQINASSVVDSIFTKYRKKVDKYLKLNLVHFVASDIHSGRKYLLDKAYLAIKKKFGKECADKLFIENGKKVIKNETIEK